MPSSVARRPLSGESCLTVLTAPFLHTIADFGHVPEAQLRDTALVTGLLIAAASAAGFTAHTTPVVRALPGDGVVGLFALEGCHMAVHTFPERGVLLLDVLAPAAFRDVQKAVDVFVRRVGTSMVRMAQHPRG